MIKVGDTVKVTGTTSCGGFEKECIPIGTVCEVTGTYIDEKDRLVIGLVPVNDRGYGEYWYLANAVEKGHLEWVRD